MSGEPLLSAVGVLGGYGGADILHGIDLSVGRREIVGIVGPNGAGKSTALKAIFGLLTLRGGEIRFDDRDITGWAPNRIVRCGIGRSEERRVGKKCVRTCRSRWSPYP